MPISQLGVNGCHICLDLWNGKVADLSDTVSVELEPPACAAFLIGGASEL
jgi:hypothetical protein